MSTRGETSDGNRVERAFLIADTRGYSTFTSQRGALRRARPRRGGGPGRTARPPARGPHGAAGVG